ncbi:MAG: hypothetical protein WBK15_12595 [Yoonia sp.]
MAKRVSAQRVKIHRQYTYESAADAVGVTDQTVRSWRKEGLVVLDSKKPHLILGHELKQFIENRTQKKCGKLGPDEFYCMKCSANRHAYGAMADYLPFNDTRGRLVALCDTCQTTCGKFAAASVCEDWAAILTIVMRDK